MPVKTRKQRHIGGFISKMKTKTQSKSKKNIKNLQKKIANEQYKNYIKYNSRSRYSNI